MLTQNKIPNTKINRKPYKWLQSCSRRRFAYLYGGAASSKSWALTQYLILEKLYGQTGIGILALRKTKPSVKVSCYRLVLYWLNQMGLDYKENKSDWTITAPTGSFIKFDSIDDVEKKKSIEGINYIWLEEATEFNEHEVMQLNLRCRATNKHGINQMFFTFNPIDPIGNEWLETRQRLAKTHVDKITGERDSDDLILVHTDNPFLSLAERSQIEALADQDEEYNKIYRLGQWATPTNLIYSNWDIIERMPERYDDRAWGLDFGYSSSEVALIEVRFAGTDIYEREHLYQTGLTNPQLIAKLKTIIESPFEQIIADCAEPKSIQEISNAGLNILPCKKGTDSVRHGINTVKSFKIHVTVDSVNLIKEKKGYKWKLDKDDNPLPEPLKFNDHLMDAERYVIQKIKGKAIAGLMLVTDTEEHIEEDVELVEAGTGGSGDIWSSI